MKKKLKTITLGGSNGDPSCVICPGHVDQKTFNAAHKAEGWCPGGWYRQKDLEYTYMSVKKLKNGQKRYSRVPPTKKGAKAFTWVSWD